MKRRQFLTAAGASLTATAVASPAIAQSMPEVKWRLTSGFPKSLDTLYGAAELFSRYAAEATDGKFQVQVFAANEIVPTLQAIDAVGNGTVELAHTASYYHVGKDPTFAFGTTIPFGPNSRQMTAWVYQAGGLDLLNEFYGKHNLHMLPGGNTGTQMGGWFRKEIKTVDDLKGLKFRIAGIAGQVLQKLGVVPQQIPGGDIYPALERGTIDAAEWVGPYDDEKLGFYRVAPYYYFPGFWEGSAMLGFFFNTEKWNALPKSYKAIAQAAAAYAHSDMQAKYDTRNPGALSRLLVAGAQLRPFSQEIMEASFKAANELYDEVGGKNAQFKRIYDNLRAFRNEEYAWFRSAEYYFDNFMIRAGTRN